MQISTFLRFGFVSWLFWIHELRQTSVASCWCLLGLIVSHCLCYSGFINEGGEGGSIIQSQLCEHVCMFLSAGTMNPNRSAGLKPRAPSFTVPFVFLLVLAS